MNFSLKLLNSDSDIRRQILSALKSQAQAALNKSKNDMTSQISVLVKQSKLNQNISNYLEENLDIN